VKGLDKGGYRLIGTVLFLDLGAGLDVSSIASRAAMATLIVR
jgi:hypothetical protein